MILYNEENILKMEHGGSFGQYHSLRKMAVVSSGGTAVDISVSFALWQHSKQTVAVVAPVTQCPLGSAHHSNHFWKN